MSVCPESSDCSFFSDSVGFSPELFQTMQATYCYGDNSGCARMMAMQVLPSGAVPRDLIPSDVARAELLIAEFRK